MSFCWTSSSYSQVTEINADGTYTVGPGADTASLAIGTVAGSITVQNGGVLIVCGRYEMITSIAVPWW